MAAELNWYLTTNLKFAVMAERTAYLGGAAAGDRAAEWAFLGRFQVWF
jgi:hypothetical protein